MRHIRQYLRGDLPPGSGTRPITRPAPLNVNRAGWLAAPARLAAPPVRRHCRGPALALAVALAAVLALLSIAPAAAQQAGTPGERATTLPPIDDEPELDEVRFTIGMAGSYSPSYSGSDEMGYALAPAARIVWRGYSISTSSVARASSQASSSRAAETGLSGPLYRRNEFAFGLGASINRGRDVSEEDAAKGLKSIRGTIVGRLRMRYYINPDLQITALLVGDLLGRQGGLELPIGLHWGHQLRPRLLLSTDIGMTFADRKSLDNSYGIGPAEQAASGLPLYRPQAGLRELGASVALIGEPTSHWVWLARLSLVKLVGPAADSPIVKRTLMPALLVGFAYRFTLH